MADILLDCALIGALVLIKTVLLYLLAPLISKKEAVMKWKKCVFLAILLDCVFVLARTSPNYITIFNAYLAAALIGTIIGPKLFSIQLGSSFSLNLLFMFLSVVLTDGATIGMNRLIPERTTISSAMSRKLDTWTCESAEMPEMEMSSSFGEALSRAGTECIMSGPLGLFFGVSRASNAAGKVAEVQAAAARHAAFIDELSTEGMEASTNIGLLVAEASEAGTVATMGAPVEQQTAKPAPDETQPGGQAPDASAAPAVSKPDKVAPNLVAAKKDGAGNGTLVGAVAEGVGSLFNPDKEGPTPDDADPPEPESPVTSAEIKVQPNTEPAQEIAVAEPTRPASNDKVDTPKLVPLAAVKISSEIVDPLHSIPEEDRDNWAKAQSLIRVNGVMRSAAGRYTVLIKGNVIVKGETTDVDYEGEVYTFKLISVNSRDICIWAPVTSPTNAVEEESEFVPFR